MMLRSSEEGENMKKAICIFLIVVITVASVPMAMCTVAAGFGTNAASFNADFTSASAQWEGTLTDFLGYTGSGTAKTGSYFGTGGGWNNSTGNIITKNSFDFGDKFEAKFSLYTNWGNGERNNFFDDFYINIGKFRIVIADHQTRIELYYNGNRVDGDFSCPNSTYTQIRDYNYTAHFEKGKIKITSDIATYTSKFADFDDVDDAKIEINFRETWQIYKDYFHSLSVGKIVENGSTFTADFSNSSTQWSGLRTDSLGYTGSGTTYNGKGTYFGNGEGFVNTQKTGAITTVKNYDFGEEFNLNFKLYTAWANNNTNNVNRDVHIEVGKFKISVCDYQTRIVVSYNGEDITGESVCSDKAYVSPKDIEYNATIKKGNIRVTGGSLTYNSDFADFAAQDNVKVSVSINETWQIHKIYFSKLSVKAASEIPQNNKSFTADFKKSSSQWQESGLTKYLGYTGGGNNYSDAGEYFGNGEGWNNSTGAITTVNSYDFGEYAEMSFCFWTYYANGNKNNAGLDAYIDVGPFRICLCDYQTRIVVKYNGETINGNSVCSNDTYLSPKTQSYTVFIEKGKIEIKSETVKYTSDFDGFDALDNVKVSVGISETWQIYELCFKSLKITGKTETTPVAPKTELSADFSSTYGVEGLTQYIGYGKYGDTYGTDDSTPLQKGTLTFKDTYDFGNKAHLRFNLYTKTNGEFSGEDFYVNVGKFKLAVCNGQNDIKLYYDGIPVGGDTVFKFEDSSAVKSYEYNAYFEKGNIVVESNLVKFTSSFSGFETINEAKVSISIDNTYAVYKKFYFSDFAVNVEKKAYKNGGNIFYTDFSDKTPFEGKLLSSVDTVNNLFPLIRAGKILPDRLKPPMFIVSGISITHGSLLKRFH